MSISILWIIILYNINKWHFVDGTLLCVYYKVKRRTVRYARQCLRKYWQESGQGIDIIIIQ